MLVLSCACCAGIQAGLHKTGNWEAFSHGQNGREKCFDNQQNGEPIVSRACVGVKGQIPMRSKTALVVPE